MIAQSKALFDRESRQRMLDPMFTRPAPQAAPISPLARAAAAPLVGEHQLTGQIYQYTLADGRRFCVAQPPNHEFANRDGPVPTMAVATNCPR